MKIRLIAYINAFILLFFFYSCSKMDDYKKNYLPNGSITYTGKIDSVKVFSGYKRVKFMAQLNSDARVSSYRVYWGNRTDSIVFKVTQTEGDRNISQIIPNLDEGEYSFEFVTYDSIGNNSVPTFQNGTVYGDNYISYLNNRRFESSELTEDLETKFTLIDMDKSTGIKVTEVKYLTRTGDSALCIIPVDTKDTILPNHKYGTAVLYRSDYLPNSTDIDTLKTAYSTYQPVSGASWVNLTKNYLKNYGNPFTYSSWDGKRWGILSDWTTTSPVKNAGGYGGYELRSSGAALSFEAGWGIAAVTNGKIYQQVHLDKVGKWRFAVNISDKGTAGTLYLFESSTTSIPDISNITTSGVPYKYLTPEISGATPYVEFTISEEGDYIIGFIATMPDTGTYFKAKAVTLSYYNE